MKHCITATLVLVLLAAAVFFGLKLGPRPSDPLAGPSSEPRQVSSQAAILAAKGFVREAVRLKKESTGEAILAPIVEIGQKESDPTIWVARGTGIVGMQGRGMQPIRWQTVQRWDADDSGWYLKEITVTRNKLDKIETK
ncbi:MAG: hypothetical protein V4671_14935 [Armatimonadota bacterium]